MNRTVILNPIEPGPLSWRHPLGTDLYLSVEFRDIRNALVDPTTVMPQLMLFPRSNGGIYGYAMTPLTAAAYVEIPGTAITDRTGYNVELYSRNVDTLTPKELVAQGSIAVQGSAFRQLGPFGQMSAPTGPMGPEGPPGKAGPEGEQGQRGSIWFSGDGPPSGDIQAQALDMYLDNLSGNVWQFTGQPLAWVRQ